MIWLLAALALADPTPEQLAADYVQTRDALAQGGVYALDFTEDEWKDLAKGKLAKRRERLDGTDRVLGAIWTPKPRDTVWVATQDEAHWDVVNGLTEETLPETTFQNKLLFQHIDLPWPFSNRQWMIRVVNNLPLLESTDGRVWERTWDLDPARGAQAEEDGAIWVDVNDGGWLCVEVGGGTLLVYHVRSRIGGAIPDEVATQWAYSTLGGMLKEIVRRADEETEGHYVGDHDLIKRPDGTEIGVFK